MKRILVVDDDAPTRELLAHTLREAGYKVLEAADGAAALARLRRDRFHLVLLDVWMPRKTGLDVLARIQKKKAAPRIIIMTTDDTPDTVLRAVRDHACRYVSKPVPPQELLDVVRATLAAPAKLPPIEVLSAKPNWVELLVPCSMEAVDRLKSFLKHLEANLPEDVRDKVGQAFHELLLNAIEWGGKLNPRSKVRIAYVRTPRMLLYRIADPGAGFSFKNLSHSAVSNPEEAPFQHTFVREEKGLRPGGFGILLTKSQVDELVYNEKQNEVLFVKFLSS
jgi:DNA-binding response OmpR family regulator